MKDMLLSLLQALVPAFLICGLFYWWSRRSRSPFLAQILRYSALFWAVWLAWCFAFYTFVNGQCGGNWLYGFTDCIAIPDNAAEMLVATSIFSFGAAVAYGCALLIGGAIAEAFARKYKPKKAP